jgi:uracil-DNA glycosylase family 4
MQKAPYAVCHKCPFRDRPIAKTTGPANAKIAVVSRSPGHYEALNGKSFSGPSGKVLDHLLLQQNVSRETVLATNVVLCQSEGPEEDGWNLAVACCAPRLESEIARADTIIACGREAADELFGEPMPIHYNRGFVHDLESTAGKLQRVIITNNPAVVIRDDGSFPELVRDFRLAINPLPKPRLPDVVMIDDIEQAKDAATKILGQFEVMGGSFYADTEKIVSCDIEARGAEGSGESGLSKNAEVVCAGFAIRPERAVVFGERPCYDSVFRREYLARLFEVEGIRYLWHNGKYDIKVLRTQDINARVDEDSMLLSWCLDERPGDPESGAGGHSLEWLLKDELGWPKYEPESVKHFKKTGELNSEADRRALYRYNGLDTAGAFGLFTSLADRAKLDNVWDRPYRFLLIRLSEALTRVELQGVRLDADVVCDVLEEEVWPKLRDWRLELRDFCQIKTLNPNSPQQLVKLLYDQWGIKHNLMRPKIERKGKRSTDHAVREEIIRGDFKFDSTLVHGDRVTKFVKTLDLWKSLDKQRGTYFEGLVLRRDKDGRIYTDYKIHGTESARLSSSNPNMQNVTRPKEGIPSIRAAFIPDPGCVFISGDLSQAELRTIAVLSGDTNLQSIYLDTNRSLHKETATEFYGENYTYEQYVRSKNINFGVAYWQSAFTFAQMYHMPQEEAQKYIDWWYGRFPKVWEWTKSIESQVLSEGEIQSPFGHKRRFYVIPADQSGRLHVIKEGINFLPQNIAGNVTLWALCNLAEKLDWDIAQPRITVHDNIVLNCRRTHIDEIARLTKQEMENAVKEALGWDFPFVADISIGEYNWAELEEYAI